MASRKTQEKLARTAKRLEPTPEAPKDAGEPLVDETGANAAFEEMLRSAQERQAKAEAEEKERYERQVTAHDRFVRAVEKLSEALEHVAVRIAFDHGVKQAAGEAKPTRAERADPLTVVRGEPMTFKAKPEPVEPADPVVTQEDVRRAVRDAVKGGKGHEAVELLAKFKAESVSDLKPADYPAVFAALLKLVG